MKQKISEFAQELSDIIGQPIELDHIHPTATGRYYYTPAPEEGAPLLLNHYRGPFFIDINPEDYRKLADGEVSPSDYIRTANWLIGYYWGGGSMIGGGYYQPIDIINRKDEVKRYFKILSCRGRRNASGYMPNEKQCLDCNVENCPFSKYKQGSWDNELEEYDPRVDFFKAVCRKFNDQFPEYVLRGFCSDDLDEYTIVLCPNVRFVEAEPFSFEVYASNKTIMKLMMRELEPEDWDEFVKKFKFLLHKRFSKEYTEVTEEQMKTMLSEVDWVNKPVENKEEKNKTGIFKRILNFFKK